MAGNIIPAIATTNAIVAGLCVLQANHVLTHNLEKARNVFISRRPDQAFIAEPLRPPNPYCQVCSTMRGQLQISPDTTLNDIVERLRLDLDYGEEISLLGEGGKLLFDIDFDDLLDRRVTEIGLTEGHTLTIVDEETDRVNLEFIISDGDTFKMGDVGPIPKKPPPMKEVNGVENGVANKGKRAREEDEDDGVFRKKPRVDKESSGEDVIVIDDDDTILID